MQQDKSIILEFIKNYIIPLLKKLYHYAKHIGTKISLKTSHIRSQEKLIQDNFRKFHNGLLPSSDKNYQAYKEAIFKRRLVGVNFYFLAKLYNRYLYPRQKNQDYLNTGQLKLLLTAPHDYVVMTKTDYQNTIAQEVNKQVADKAKAIRQEFIDKLLPFTSSKEQGSLSQDYFTHKDASRMKYYAQQKRIEKLEERERKTQLKEENLELKENKLDAQQTHMDVKNERIGLQSDKLDLEKEALNIDKKKLEVQKEKLDVQQDRIELQQLQLTNERKLLELHIAKQEIEHKTKMLELMNLSLDIQKQTNDIEQTKKEIEITQDLHDLETRRREQTLEYGQQLLQLKEQGLENQMQRKEAEFLRLQMDNQRTQIDIENRIMDLRESEFKQKSKEQLLEIKKRETDIQIEKMKIHQREDSLQQRNNELKLELKQERIAIEKKEQIMHDKQQDLVWKLQDQKSRTFDVERENGRLVQELRKKPTYIDWNNV